ncbi:DNA lyase [Halalkalibacillus sediminis]|uniref:DNA lyase n=1 Tax=Halalkalibacillus sediminis TaxID=2018042 RepID=A0A2I0QRW8_9BACI|nr:pyrimidine dimer DNA glycosylase/endonuclease V [Halalkalibacillus sediminis]PKR77073.1 DNA lyase [Halalkalibacillus sediminis]
MRLWSINPSYLDAKGLVALWRETLLAQKVLAGQTKGYQNHPQLERFYQHEEPMKAIGIYLQYVYIEAKSRGYNFDSSKILQPEACDPIPVTTGQLDYEWAHLRAKLRKRDPERLKKISESKSKVLIPHPLFEKKEGPIASWEKI